LFSGPAGTGKTAAAMALAKSSGWAFLPTSGQELQSSRETIDRIIDRASDIRPAIVFIDEADDILQDRLTNPWGKAATNKLLAIMEGNTPLHDVMFIAATNHASIVDAAMLRDGRFGEQIAFGIPSGDTTERLILAFMEEKSATPWDAQFSVIRAARLLKGEPPANIRGRLQAAINHAITHQAETVTIEHLVAVLR
jgi:transitional endoplasmic reticulum ATPase